MRRLWAWGLFAGMVTCTAWAQLPNAGVQTDVMQTNQGELQIKPLTKASILLSWAGLEIYVDPLDAKNFAGWPKADVIVLTGPDAAHYDGNALQALSKPSTEVIAPAQLSKMIVDSHVVAPGSTQTIQISHEGKPIPMTVSAQAHSSDRGVSYVLSLGEKNVFISGDTACTPEIQALKNIAVAFIAVDEDRAMAPEVAAACVAHFQPKVVYPYEAEGNGADVFADSMKPDHDVEVRVRPW